MHTHEKLIERFYQSFQKRDAAGMLDCYHPDIHFSDPVFTDLQGAQAAAMWRMLCANARDFSLQYSDIHADDESGKAHWEARYTFSQTQRPVHNRIEASFRFQDGKIISHQDDFNFWLWSRMALGPAGLLLGWTPVLKTKVRNSAHRNLQKFIHKHPV
ncbi:MAG: nuclear transport factor 2 family protein [gamma proteobacterium symbiont of Bathyaustriella thionipta]|nr:nuclear transport factor 2 family protein [gamma proteobacterium symbiont of Bathyaustriella thionipta]